MPSFRRLCLSYFRLGFVILLILHFHMHSDDFFFFFLHCTRKFKLSLCLSDHSFCLSVSPVVFPHAASEKKGAPRGGYSRKGRIEKYRTVPITTAINSCSDLYTVEKEEYVDNIEQDDQQPNIQTTAHWKCSSTQSL